MNREAYLGALYANLRRLPEKELASVMKYYEEYFQEAGPEREEEVISELGPVDDLARQIIGRRQGGRGNDRSYQEGNTRQERSFGQIIALVCLSPLWIGLIVAAIVAQVGLVLGIGGGGLGMMGVGVFTGWCGFTAIFSPGITTTVFFGGMGILVFAGGLAMLAGALSLAKVFVKSIAAMFRWVFRGPRGYRV